LRQFLKIIVPAFVIDLYKKRRSKRNADNRKQLEIITEEEIKEALLKAGLKSGDTIMLHSSLKSLGNVKNGAADVINAFKKVIGLGGTLVMPSFPAIGFNYDYLNSDPVFDIKQTPSKMGIITEAFRKMNDVQRSFHPTDPVCVLGKQTEYLIKDHFGQLTPYNENSPFYKLILVKAKIVLIGVKLETVTNFHTPEDAIKDFKYPVYHSKIFSARMIDEFGKEVSMKTKVHDSAFSKKRKCNDLLNAFENVNVLSQFKIRNTNCMIVDAEKMHNWLIENYKNGITMYTPFGEKLN